MEKQHNIVKNQRAADAVAQTPQDLVQHHIEHDEPISNEDMANLDTGNALTKTEKESANELADAINSDGTGMSYKADV